MIIAKDLKTGGGGQGSVLNIDPTGEQKELQNKSYIVLGASSKIGSVFSKFKKKIKFCIKKIIQIKKI